MERREFGDADMTDPVREQLSACLDGELPEGELDLMLKQAARDSQLRSSMDRYALIGEVLRGQVPVRASRGFADRVAATVAAETAPAVPVSRVRQAAASRWMGPVAGVAVAAGVAAMAILTLQPATNEMQPVSMTADLGQVQSEEPPSYTVPTNLDSTGTAFIPAARLTNYVVAHSEFSSPLGRRTVLSGVLSEDEEGQADDNQGTVTGAPEPTDVSIEQAGSQR